MNSMFTLYSLPITSWHFPTLSTGASWLLLWPWRCFSVWSSDLGKGLQISRDETSIVRKCSHFGQLFKVLHSPWNNTCDQDQSRLKTQTYKRKYKNTNITYVFDQTQNTSDQDKGNLKTSTKKGSTALCKIENVQPIPSLHNCCKNCSMVLLSSCYHQRIINDMFAG